MGTFRDEAFAQASKWLELALTEQKGSGRGQGTTKFEGIQDLKTKVDTPNERDELCPAILFTFSGLRQTYDLTPNSAMKGAVTTSAPRHLPSTGTTPPPPAVVPPLPPTPAELRDQRAEARGRPKESTILPADTGSPAPIPPAAPVPASGRSPAASKPSSSTATFWSCLTDETHRPGVECCSPGGYGSCAELCRASGDGASSYSDEYARAGCVEDGSEVGFPGGYGKYFGMSRPLSLTIQSIARPYARKANNSRKP